MAQVAFHSHFRHLKDPRRCPRHLLLDIIGIAIRRQLADQGQVRRRVAGLFAIAVFAKSDVYSNCQCRLFSMPQ